MVVEKSVTLLTAEELAQFRADYAGYYPFAAPNPFTVEYDWGTEFQEGETLPTNCNTTRRKKMRWRRWIPAIPTSPPPQR